MDKFKDFIVKKVKPSRYQHSVNVADLMHIYAKNLKLDTSKAYSIGILHDCAKDCSEDLYLNYCKAINYKVDEHERNELHLLHGASSVYIIKKELNIYNEEILFPIKYHTTGHKNFDIYGKLLYIADFIEPTRNHPKNIIDKISNSIYANVDYTLDYIIQIKLKYLKENNLEVHPRTLEFLESINRNLNEHT